MTAGTIETASVVSIALMVFACGNDSKVECECVDSALEVRVPSERAAAVVDVAASGPACDGVQATCAEQSGGACVRFALVGRAAGNCHVDVDFASGAPRFSADVKLVAGGCCPGFYADPPSAGMIDVPSFAMDAGGAG
jgi:hypothetical protein